MNERWKDIEGYEGLYQVSNMGRVKSLSRFHNNKTVGFMTKDIILSKRPNKEYLCVALYKDKKRKDISIHRLVADAFLPKIDGKDWVNHKDGNKKNNCVQNLEWCTPKENVRHAFSNGLNHVERGQSNKRSRKINQYTLDGKYVATWYGLGEIHRNLNINKGNVDACLKGKRKNAGGYTWKVG